MGSHRLAFAAVAVACVVAAGGGSYLATRHNLASVTTPDAAAAPAAAVPFTPAAEPAAGVEPALEAPVARAAVAPPAATVRPVEPPKRVERPAGRPQAAEPGRRNTADPRTIDRPSVPDTPIQIPSSIEPLPSTQTHDDRPFDAPRAPEPPARTFEELVVSAESVIGLQMDGMVTSERARVEDRVEARVSRDVRVNGDIAIPAGTRALGNVVLVEHGGRMRERARLGIRFHTLVLGDGTRVPITTDPVYRLGEAPGNGSAAKIGGGAVAGAILGAIIGGGKGAAIGATTGAGAGTAAVMAGDPRPAVFPAGADVTARITSPVTITIERE